MGRSAGRMGGVSVLGGTVLANNLIVNITFSTVTRPRLGDSIPRTSSTMTTPRGVRLGFSRGLAIGFSNTGLAVANVGNVSSRSPVPITTGITPNTSPGSVIVVPQRPLPTNACHIS